MKCPVCGTVQAVYKCDNCGEIRCAGNKCPGSISGKQRNASANSKCLACGKGKYKKM